MADHDLSPQYQPDDATILRYLSGACEPAELARVVSWLKADPARQAEIAALQVAWNPAPPADADPDDRMWRSLAARMNEGPRPFVLQPQTPSSKWQHLRRIGVIAATLLLIAGGAFLLRFPLGDWRAGAGAPFAGAPFVGALMQELVTPRGARVTGNLPDGSRVVLAPGSRLQIPTSFAINPSAAGGRDVYLQGEAFFEVTHDARRPFRVHTANGIVEDLGTEFVVTAYPESGVTRAVVASGVVALRGRGRTTRGDVTLRTGDLGRIDAAGPVLLAKSVDVAKYVNWTRGELVFDHVPLQEAIVTIGRWYDVNIELVDTVLGHRRLTTTFHDESIAEVLRVLEVAFAARAEHAGRSIVLRGRLP